ncbi:MAG TPA: hypothetical protein VE954_06540 [Oligoflexus sp.]|uniref:hypothetical protein n=1 Tax=Oligoflexus sp. TaxID=1971216 RepID=UPI002D5049EA|nr:hypothetical protein [Oligoflexus sp.]HYX32754.1 hypothetical protein [Oligoflexus sp.]
MSSSINSDFDNLIEKLAKASVIIRVASDDLDEAEPEYNGETLFYEPLIALAVLILTSIKYGSLQSGRVSFCVSQILATIFPGFSPLKRRLEWSIVLKSRCADALCFLEASDLVKVTTERSISITERGRNFLSQRKNADAHFALLARSIERAIGNLQLFEEIN